MVASQPSPPRSRGPYQAGARLEVSPPCSPGSRPMFTSSPSFPSLSSTPLAIRGAQMEAPPPPLPPPRNLPLLSLKQSPAWGPSRQPLGATGSLPPAGSSLHGSWSQSSDEELSFGRRKVKPRKTPWEREPLPSPLAEEVKEDDEDDEDLFHPQRTLERPLEMHNHNAAIHAYDKHQLSKLGRPKTPNLSKGLRSVESSPITANKPLRLESQPSFHKLTLADPMANAPLESSFKQSSPWSAGAKWSSHTSQPDTISPSVISSATSTRSSGFPGPRSPGSAYDSSTAPSSFATEHTGFSRVGSLDSRSNASILSGAFDVEVREKNRHVPHDRIELGMLNRESFDHVPVTDYDSEFTARGPSASSHAYHEADFTHSLGLEAPLQDMAAGLQHGVKRKASPLLDETGSAELGAHVSRSRTPGRAKRSSPTYQSTALHASHVLQANAKSENASFELSHRSVAPIAVVADSQDQSSPITNASSTADLSDSRLSHSPYGSSLDYGTHHGPRSQGQTSMPNVDASGRSDRSLGKAGRDQNLTSGNPLAHDIHMCDCCPKKPRKFSTKEQLEAHRREKQFSCQYCNNRFKNKNEAERHQNSLHLRRQSWSCAALGNMIDRAFHPCTAPPSSNPQQIQEGQHAPAEHDICGFCGKEYSNYPQNWEERREHLTEVHKFGECNQAKKFFRADHFRQHLKHSHQGTSGKWTNMLEQACIREEAPTGADGLPIDQLRQQQQQAAQALQAVSAPTMMSAYTAEGFQPAVGSLPPASLGRVPVQAQRSQYGSFPTTVSYEETEEEGNARE